MNPINYDSIDCIICFETFEEDGEEDKRVLDCGHIFHEACINLWIAKNPTCPYCRKKVEVLTDTHKEINSVNDSHGVDEDRSLLFYRAILVAAFLFTSLCRNED